jgi:endo-1,4-beta-xylanase
MNNERFGRRKALLGAAAIIGGGLGVGALAFLGLQVREDRAADAQATATRLDEIEVLRRLAAESSLRDIAGRAGIRSAALLTALDAQQFPAGSVEAGMIREAATIGALDGVLYWGQSLDDFTDPARISTKFNDAAAVISYGQSMGIGEFSGRHMIWGNEGPLPDWIVEGVRSGQLDARTVIEQRITQLASEPRFAPVTSWSVVNEIVPRIPNEEGKNFFGETVGIEETIDLAFATARAARPNDLLIINDFDNHNRYRRDRAEMLYQMVKAAKERGTPIDAVGMQMHFRAGQEFNVEEMARTMADYGELGVRVVITELNVKTDQFQGSPEQALAAQAATYQNIGLAAAASQNVDMMTLFGIHEETSYVDQYSRAQTDALLAEGQQWKPSYQGLKEGLLGIPASQ